MKTKTYFYLCMAAIFLYNSFSDDKWAPIFGIIFSYVKCLIDNRHRNSVSIGTLFQYMIFGLISSIMCLYGKNLLVNGVLG